MMTDCCLNSNQQPVAMATMVLVRSPILEIRSWRSHLTPVSAVSPHISLKSSVSGGLRLGDRKGSSPWWAVGDVGRHVCVVRGDESSWYVQGKARCSMTALLVARGQSTAGCFSLCQRFMSEGSECPGYLGPLRVRG